MRNPIRLLSIAVLSYLGNGCAQLDSYERTYGARYNADTQSGEISLTLRPIAKVAQTPAAPTTLTDEVILKIVKLIMESKPVTSEVVKVIDFKQPVEALLK